MEFNNKLRPFKTDKQIRSEAYNELHPAIQKTPEGKFAYKVPGTDYTITFGKRKNSYKYENYGRTRIPDWAFDIRDSKNERPLTPDGQHFGESNWYQYGDYKDALRQLRNIMDYYQIKENK